MCRLRILPPLAILALASCQGLGPRLTPVVRDVPFLAQEQHQCGAAALGMILAYWDRPAPTDTLVSELYIPSRLGTPPALIIAAAHQRNLNTRCVAASMDDLMAALAAGQPPIVFLAPAQAGSPGHFAVVTGIRRDASAIRLHDPTRPNRWWPAASFLPRWQNGKNLTLFFSPAPIPPVPVAPTQPAYIP